MAVCPTFQAVGLDWYSFLDLTMLEPKTGPIRRILVILGGGCCVALACLTFRLAAIDGLLSPIRVVGPSMAPTLWGPFRKSNCLGCGFSIRAHLHRDFVKVDITSCPNCGTECSLTNSQVHLADVVTIDRGAFWFKNPTRGDLVALRDSSGTLRVKRVIALPGDTVSVDQSVLRVNQRPINSILTPAKRPWVTVHLDAYRGPAGSRWRFDSDGLWGYLHHGMKCSLPEFSTKQKFANSWLVYQHRSCHDAGRPAPIRDDYPANVGLSRQLAPVNDLMIQGTILSTTPFVLEVDFWQPGNPIRASSQWGAGEHPWKIESAAMSPEKDAKPSQGKWQRVSKNLKDSPVSPNCPIAIRIHAIRNQQPSGKTEVRIENLQIARRLLWSVRRHDLHSWQQGPLFLEADQYFVVGDNLPVSVDCRANRNTVDRSEIVGRVSRRTSS